MENKYDEKTKTYSTVRKFRQNPDGTWKCDDGYIYTKDRKNIICSVHEWQMNEEKKQAHALYEARKKEESIKAQERAIEFAKQETEKHILKIPNETTEIKEQEYLSNKCIEVHIPKSVIKIGALAFAHSSIKIFNLPNSIEEIGHRAFSNSKVKNVKLPSKLKVIHKGTFFHCKQLQSIILPKTLTEIGDEAFRECNKLKKIIIPKSVVIIGDWAFADCKNLEEVIIQNPKAEISKTAFLGIKKII